MIARGLQVFAYQQHAGLMIWPDEAGGAPLVTRSHPLTQVFENRILTSGASCADEDRGPMTVMLAGRGPSPVSVTKMPIAGSSASMAR